MPNQKRSLSIAVSAAIGAALWRPCVDTAVGITMIAATAPIIESLWSII
jgi:hypothetical protein